MSLPPDAAPVASATRVRVWDLPTRLFHWSLAACTLSACISARLNGPFALRLHFLSGYAVLVLIGFRVLWGFAGSHYARFAQFVRGPSTTLRYLRLVLSGRQGSDGDSLGHNPLGAISVLALLAICALLAASGLFTKDYVASEGPLVRFISEKSADRYSMVHAWGEVFFYLFVVLHLGAIAFYRFARGQDLIGPMLSGEKILREPLAEDPPAASRSAPHRLTDAQSTDSGTAPAGASQRTNLRALLLFGLCAALVAYVVRL